MCGKSEKTAISFTSHTKCHVISFQMDATSEHYRFYVFAETRRGQILSQLGAAFGNSAPSSTFVYKWAEEFSNGNHECVKRLLIPGRPVSKRTDKNISLLFDYITAEPKAT